MRRLTLIVVLASCSSNAGAPWPDPKYALTHYLAEVGRLPEKQKMNRYLNDQNGCKHDVPWSVPCDSCGRLPVEDRVNAKLRALSDALRPK